MREMREKGKEGKQDEKENGGRRGEYKGKKGALVLIVGACMRKRLGACMRKRLGASMRMLGASMRAAGCIYVETVGRINAEVWVEYGCERTTVSHTPLTLPMECM